MAQRVFLCGLAVAVLLAGGCGGNDDDSGGDVATACDAGVEYGTAVQSAQGASDADELREALEPTLEQLVDTAKASGDEVLDQYAGTIELDLDRYLDGKSDGAAADESLDAMMARCIELGEGRDFPQQGDGE